MRGRRLIPARRILWTALALAWLVPARGALGADGSLEAEVKAAYLYKFAPFIDWPASAFSGPGAAFQICVVGDDGFADLVSRAVSGQKVGGRPFVVRRMAQAAAGSGCQIMYWPGAAPRPAVKLVSRSPVLTVASGGDGSDAIITFVLDQGRVRFAVNDAAAADSGLAISSSLLRLALNVVTRREGMR